jgi:hypothetical protein
MLYGLPTALTDLTILKVARTEVQHSLDDTHYVSQNTLLFLGSFNDAFTAI